MLLDPTLPEKQRARRRLVGAIALVVAAVVILPMVLDSHPKPVTDDISIDIPSRPVSRARVQDPQDTQAGVAPDNPVAPEGAQGSAAGVQSAPAPSSESPSATAATGASSRGGATQTHMQTQGEEAGKQAQQQTQSAGKVQQAPVTATNNAATNNAAAAAKPAARSTQSATQTGTRPESTAQSATAALAESGTPASPPGNRFAVQLGSFSDDASARSWASKLKAAGVPAYLEKRKQADGSTRTLLRAGPFADRAAASAAIAKVREAGLTSGPNNGSAQ